MTNTTPSEPSELIRTRVEKARKIQQIRLEKYGIYCNAQMSHKSIKATCKMTSNAQSLLKTAFDKMGLSARAYDRIIKVARTAADLESSDMINETNIAEAIHYRSNLSSLF